MLSLDAVQGINIFNGSCSAMGTDFGFVMVARENTRGELFTGIGTTSCDTVNITVGAGD